MKKNTFVLLSFTTILLVWCTTDTQIEKINPEEWIAQNGVSVEESFNSQIDQAQYLVDLEDFISYNILSYTENKPYNSEISLDMDFNKDSSVQGWLDFYQKKFTKSYNNEKRDIIFNILANSTDKKSTPFEMSWSVSLLYQNDEMYANLHKLWVFMWEGNMTAKMYTLLWDLLIDKRVDLEIHSWWVISIEEGFDTKLPHIIWTIKNILKTEDIQSSPNFLWSIVELIDTINDSYINLWISTNELTILGWEISYSEFWDNTIQKTFTWSFQWKDSSFDLSFTTSKKWLEIHIYNIKEYDEDISNYKDKETEYSLSIRENKKSEYSIDFQSLQRQQKIANLQWIIKYTEPIKISADFILEPLELIKWQKISWKLEWKLNKESWNTDEKFPELSWEILSLSELLSSL